MNILEDLYKEQVIKVNELEELVYELQEENERLENELKAFKTFRELNQEHQQNIVDNMLIFKQSEINQNKELEKTFGKRKK